MTAFSDRSARVESQAGSSLVGPGNPSKSAGDSLCQKSSSNKRSYVTRSRVEAIRSQLNPSQKAILSDVGRLGLITGSQVQRLYYEPSISGGRLARKHLGQLIDWQVLLRLKRSVGGERAGSSGYVYALGAAGQRLLHPNRSRYVPVWTPRPSHLRHAVSVSELYISLREVEHNRGDMELTTYDTEPRCWRHYFGPGGARTTLKPDALAAIANGDYEYRYFIEMDCSTEHRPQIVAKAKTYVRYRQSGREQAATDIFPFVLWVTPTDKRRSLIIDALATLPPEHWQLFMVATADEAAERMTRGTAASINQKEVTK
jgi:hypothetical protein